MKKVIYILLFCFISMPLFLIAFDYKSKIKICIMKGGKKCSQCKNIKRFSLYGATLLCSTYHNKIYATADYSLCRTIELGMIMLGDEASIKTTGLFEWMRRSYSKDCYMSIEVNKNK